MKSIQNQPYPSSKKYQRTFTRYKLKKRITVIVIWIPSHVGITGNEEADHIAKEAVTSKPIQEIRSTEQDLIQ